MGDSISYAYDQREEAEAAQYLASPQYVQDKKDMEEWNLLVLRAQTMTVFTLTDLSFLQTCTGCGHPQDMCVRRGGLSRLRQIVTHGESDLSCELRKAAHP